MLILIQNCSCSFLDVNLTITEMVSTIGLAAFHSIPVAGNVIVLMKRIGYKGGIITKEYMFMHSKYLHFTSDLF